MTNVLPCDTASLSPPRPEIAALQEVMQAIEDQLPDILAALPESRHPLLANALLNLRSTDPRR